MITSPKITVVAQWDDHALYIDNQLFAGGDCKYVNGMISILEKLNIPIEYKSIHYDIWNYDIWKENDGWPILLSNIKNIIN